MDEYLKQFLIGSSIPVVIPFYISVMNINPNIKNYSYSNYTLIAPIYFGIMTMLSLFLAKKYNLDNRNRFLLIGIISATLVCTFSTLTKSYNFTTKEWIIYYISIFIRHILTYNITIYYLNKFI